MFSAFLMIALFMKHSIIKNATIICHGDLLSRWLGNRGYRNLSFPACLLIQQPSAGCSRISMAYGDRQPTCQGARAFFSQIVGCPLAPTSSLESTPSQSASSEENMSPNAFSTTVLNPPSNSPLPRALPFKQSPLPTIVDRGSAPSPGKHFPSFSAAPFGMQPIEVGMTRYFPRSRTAPVVAVACAGLPVLATTFRGWRGRQRSV